jgi:integrase
MSDNVSDATRITTGKIRFESRLAIRRSHIYDRHHHTVDPVREVVRLKVASIDSQRMLLHIEAGKGNRDRYAMLSPRLLGILRAYWKRAQPRLWLFPGQEPGDHLSTGALQGRLSEGKEACSN